MKNTYSIIIIIIYLKIFIYISFSLLYLTNIRSIISLKY